MAEAVRQSHRERHSVAIVGGGIAGLAAARHLFRAGVDVVLLEARRELGGRIRTARDLAPFPVDLGAEFVHGRPPRLLAEIRAAKLHLQEESFDPILLDHGRLIPASHSWERMFAELRRAPRHDLPFGLRIAELEHTRRLTPQDAQVARQYVEGYMAADVERVSTQALAKEASASEAIQGEHAYRVREGYAALVDAFAGDIPHDRLRTDAAVLSIRWRPGSVEIVFRADSQSGRLLAERAIITMPLGLWQLSHDDPARIQIEPELCAKNEAARQLGMGSVVKTFLRLRGPLSSATGISRGLRTTLRGASFFLVRDAPIPTWWTVGPSEAPMLVGWSGGRAALKLRATSAARISATAVKVLASAVGTSERAVASLIESAHFVDWREDPFTQGAYSWVPAGAFEAPGLLARPVADTLFFGGEATDTLGYRGTVHGALLTGLRAAAEVLRAAAPSRGRRHGRREPFRTSRSIRPQPIEGQEGPSPVT